MAEEVKDTGTTVEATKAVPEIDYGKLASAIVEAQKPQSKPDYEDSTKDAPNIGSMSPVYKYDRYSVEDLAFGISALKALEDENLKDGGGRKFKVSGDLMGALSTRVVDEYLLSKGKERREEVGWMKQIGIPTESALKSFEGWKANEIHYSTQSGAIDEWVGTAYSPDLWNQIRQATPVMGKIPEVVIPQGAESVTIGTQTGSVTFYLVAQAASQDANPGQPAETFTSSKMTTAQKVLGCSKIGAAAGYSGEAEEDSFLAFVETLRQDMIAEGAEVFEHVIIDGDTATGATTNINDIADTPGGTEVWLAVDGLRKLPLVTNTDNSTSVGTLTVSDFLSIAKLLGPAGLHALDNGKVGYIMDANTRWTAMQLAEVHTRDVNTQATVENGRLSNIYGYDVLTSANMHRASAGTGYERKANTSGKIDLDTDSNNTTGSILAVRYDQWKIGRKRNFSMEAQRFPLADTTMIVANMRFGLTYRSTDAAAIGYNVTL